MKRLVDRLKELGGGVYEEWEKLVDAFRLGGNDDPEFLAAREFLESDDWYTPTKKYAHLDPAPPRTKTGLEVPARMFKGKKASARRDILWACEMLYVSDVRASMAPSAYAWTLLVRARQDTTGAKALIDLSKTLVPKEDDDREARIADDERTTAELIREIRVLGPDALHSSGAERVLREPGLPGEGAADGGLQPEDAAEPADVL